MEKTTTLSHSLHDQQTSLRLVIVQTLDSTNLSRRPWQTDAPATSHEFPSHVECVPSLVVCDALFPQICAFPHSTNVVPQATLLSDAAQTLTVAVEEVTTRLPALPPAWPATSSCQPTPIK